MEVADNITPLNAQSTPNQPESTPDHGKSQLPGESALWFRRYCLYRDLGHKRSLRAAVAREAETARLVKETEPAPKSPGKTKKTGVDASDSKRAINVPGSWKHASKVYRWAERTAQFDQWVLNKMVTATYNYLGDTYANKYKRVQLLEVLIKSTLEQQSNASSNNATHETYLAYVKQIAALLKQMESEMSTPEEEMKLAIAAYARTFRDEIEQALRTGQAAISPTPK